jgi:ligand-binding sensor domain-containing protein
MAQTRDGAVWVAYADGSVCRIIRDEVTRFTARDGLSGAGACGVANDTEGRLWFAKSGRVGIWESGQFTPLHTIAVAAETMRLATARDGGLWICAGLQLFKCASPTNPPVEVAKIPTNRSGVEPAIVFEDREGLVWVGTTTGGLFVLEGDRWRKVNTSHEEILALAEDREGNLWVGTGGGGLDRLRPRLLDLQGVEDGLPLASIRSICEDRSGRLWAVAQNGELARHQAGRWQALSTNDGWSGMRANCVLADRDGGVWIGTYRAGLHRWQDGRLSSWQRADGLGGDVIRGLFQDSHGALWIALEANVGLQRMINGQFQTFVQPTNSRAIRALAEDAQGQMWFGTMDGFLLRAEGDRLVNETPRTLASPGRSVVWSRLPTAACGLATPAPVWAGGATANSSASAARTGCPTIISVP